MTDSCWTMVNNLLEDEEYENLSGEALIHATIQSVGLADFISLTGGIVSAKLAQMEKLEKFIKEGL